MDIKQFLDTADKKISEIEQISWTREDCFESSIAERIIDLETKQNLHTNYIQPLSDTILGLIQANKTMTVQVANLKATVTTCIAFSILAIILVFLK